MIFVMFRTGGDLGQANGEHPHRLAHIWDLLESGIFSSNIYACLFCKGDDCSNPDSDMLKKNLANKIFGYLARCERKKCI